MTEKKTEASRMRRRDIDMTSGNIVRCLISFALPIFISQIFLRLYTMVDTWVVGNYVSDAAFAAVGSVGSIYNLLVTMGTGLTTGAGVVIAQYVGARNDERIHDAVHTAFAITLTVSAAVAILGIGLAPALLRLTRTPESVFADARTYLSILFVGAPGSLIYGISASTLRATGDSRKPLYFLISSAVVNTVLDLVFVLQFNWGVAGVAWATAIANYVDGLAAVALMRSPTAARLRLRDIRFHRELLRKIISVAIPTVIQLSITAFSNMFVQGYINVFDKFVMSGWTMRNKCDSILCVAATCFSLATNNFVGQNLGRGQVDRAKKGVRIAMGITLAGTLVLIVLVEIFAPQVVYFFNRTPEIIQWGTTFLRWQSPFYLFYVADQIYVSALRGAGNTKAPMIVMLSSYVVFRQIYLYVMSNFFINEPVPITLGFPLGWILACTQMFLYYRHTDLAKTRLVSDDEVRE